MSLTVTDSTGSSCTTLNVIEISEVHPTKSVIIETTGIDYDVVQMFGASNRTFNFKGVTRTLDEKVFLQNAMNNTGSISFTSDIGLIQFITGPQTIEADFDSADFDSDDFNTGETKSGSASVQVYFHDLEFKDLGSRPLERLYKFTAVEIK